MDRRAFVGAGLGTALGAQSLRGAPDVARRRAQDDIRALFPRLEREVFLNAAGGTPLGRFADAGLRRYMDFQRLGPGEDRGEYVGRVSQEIRALFGNLIGAHASEVALVHCTKAGEQLVLDGLDPRRHGRNVVTNDMHFSGSLHNYLGLRRLGLDVRIVRADDWDVSVERMAAAIDRNTALVAVTLVSNVNGRTEQIREVADYAHARGALVYADIIQGAGIVPVDVKAAGIDFAACSGYKWLYGVHGVGFLYVRQDLQGTALPDRLFPGHANPTYAPWVAQPQSTASGDYTYRPRHDASRYEPGHVSYLGYCALYEGLRFLDRVGVDRALRHSVRLNERLLEQLDARFPCITPDPKATPMVTFLVPDAEQLAERLSTAGVVVAFQENRMRVSPALYNHEGDIDALVAALAA